MKFTTLFDYIFYRALVFFENRRRDEDTWYRATHVVTALQIGLFSVVVLLLSRLLEITTGRLGHGLLIGLAGLIMLLNHSRYEKKERSENDYAVFRERWDSEDPGTRRMRGWLVVVSLILPWLVFVGIVLAYNIV